MRRNQSAPCLFAISFGTAVLLSGTSILAVARDLPIYIEGCPSKLSLGVPSDFTAATGETQKAFRSSILNDLHGNPGRKTRYTDVLFSDWDTKSGFPQILVGSLGTTRQLQGHMTESQWRELKRTALTSSKTQQAQWVRKGLAQLEPGMSNNVQQIEGRVLRLGEGGQNDFTAFTNSTSTVAGKPLHLYSAAKLIYVKQCLAYIIVSVEVSDSDALDRLIKIVEQVNVR